MKKRVLFMALAAVMLLSSISGISNFTTAYADAGSTPPVSPSPSAPVKTDHVHKLAAKYSPEPSEAQKGILYYYCTVKGCDFYIEEEVARLPDVYVSKYRHHEDGLRMRIMAAQDYSVVNGKVDITLEDWYASQIKDKYHYEWEGQNIRGRSIEFKAKDLGIGSFDTKATEYELTVPVGGLKACNENGSVVLYLTTGAAMIRLSEDATAALVGQAKETIGLSVKVDGKELLAELMVDGKSVAAPDGVEMIYWVKDAGDMETATDDVLRSERYMDFDFEDDYDVIFVEALNGAVKLG